ncbi:MAG: hypothetical protein EBX50_23725, partial [Chitinophagia bacterium]|nr:hypothetical protein [Chitinophagia bacterium]
GHQRRETQAADQAGMAVAPPTRGSSTGQQGLQGAEGAQKRLHRQQTIQTQQLTGKGIGQGAGLGMAFVVQRQVCIHERLNRRRLGLGALALSHR